LERQGLQLLRSEADFPSMPIPTSKAGTSRLHGVPGAAHSKSGLVVANLVDLGEARFDESAGRCQYYFRIADKPAFWIMKPEKKS